MLVQKALKGNGEGKQAVEIEFLKKYQEMSSTVPDISSLEDL